MKEPPEGTHGVEILVRADQADDARRIINDYLPGAKHIEAQEPPREEEK